MLVASRDRIEVFLQIQFKLTIFSLTFPQLHLKEFNCFLGFIQFVF